MNGKVATGGDFDGEGENTTLSLGSLFDGKLGILDGGIIRRRVESFDLEVDVDDDEVGWNENTD